MEPLANLFWTGANWTLAALWRVIGGNPQRDFWGEMHSPAHFESWGRCGNESFRLKLKKTGYIISPPNMINAIFLQFMADLKYFFNLFLRSWCEKMRRMVIRMTRGGGSKAMSCGELLVFLPWKPFFVGKVRKHRSVQGDEPIF